MVEPTTRRQAVCAQCGLPVFSRFLLSFSISKHRQARAFARLVVLTDNAGVRVRVLTASLLSKERRAITE